MMNIVKISEPKVKDKDETKEQKDSNYIGKQRTTWKLCSSYYQCLQVEVTSYLCTRVSV